MNDHNRLAGRSTEIRLSPEPTKTGDDICDIVFLLEFLQELFCQGDGSRREQPYVQEFVRVGINGGVQPKSLVVELNHGFADRNVMGAFSETGWRSVFCTRL